MAKDGSDSNSRLLHVSEESSWFSLITGVQESQNVVCKMKRKNRILLDTHRFSVS